MQDKNLLSCVAKVPIFSELTEAEKNEVIMIATHHNYKKGDIIFKTGDILNSLYVVHLGKVKISRYSDDGKEQVIHILNPGEFLGELSLFKDEKVTTYAEVLEPAVICQLNSKQLKHLMINYPEISFKLMYELSRRLTTTEVMLEYHTLRSADAKMAKLLLELSDDNEVVIFPTTKTVLSSQIGVTNETFSRKLKQFTKKGLIKEVSNKKVVILKKDELEDIIFFE